MSRVSSIDDHISYDISILQGPTLYQHKWLLQYLSKQNNFELEKNYNFYVNKRSGKNIVMIWNEII